MLEIGKVDEIRLSIEPIAFGQGLPMFSGVAWAGVETHIATHGMARVGEDEVLNAAGTVERVYRRLPA